MSCRGDRRLAGERGQASVELALVLPVLALLLLLIAQVGLLARQQLLVLHAAREAARAASVDADPTRPYAAAMAATGLAAGVLRVTVDREVGGSGLVTAEVRYLARPQLPVVGAIFGRVTLRGSATMQAENLTYGDG